MVNYPRLRASNIRGLGVFNVILWVLSNTINAIICIRYSNFGNGVSYDHIGALDYVVSGIWAGLLYGIAGLLGLCASYNREEPMLNATWVFNALSIGGAICCATVSGIIGRHLVVDRDQVCNPENVYPPIYAETVEVDCTVWTDLEYSLLIVSIVASVTNLFSMILVIYGLCGPKISSDKSSRIEHSTGINSLENGNQKAQRSVDDSSKTITDEPNATANNLQTNTEDKLTDDFKTIPEEPIETESSQIATERIVSDDTKTVPEPSAVNEPEIKAEPALANDNSKFIGASESRELDNLQIISAPSANDKDTEIKTESHARSINSDDSTVNSEAPTEPISDADNLQTAKEQNTVSDPSLVNQP